MHRLDGPTRRNEVRGELFEQLGMGRWRASQPEVGGSGHNWLGKVMLPDSIDHHSSGQASRWPFCQPTGKCQATAALGRQLDGAVGLDRGKDTALDRVPELARVAADLQLHFGWLAVTN